MSAFKRTQQWSTFARVWHIFDARWQNPVDSATVIAKHLCGQWKPIYHPLNDCGDHVVVINTKHIALPGDDWYRRAYFHHRTYPGSKSWTLAWELHREDDTMIMKKSVSAALAKNLLRPNCMERLHLFPESDVPANILANVTHQIRQLRVPPTCIDAVPSEIANKFPQVFDYPKDHVLGKRYTEKEIQRKTQPIPYK